MSTYSNTDLLKSLKQLAVANDAQRQLVLKAWDRLLAAIPSDSIIAQMQQTHYPPSQGKGKGDDAAAHVMVTNFMLKRFAADCVGFTLVSITPVVEVDPKKQALLATVFAMPAQEMLYFLRILIACCLPKEGSVGPSTPPAAARLANAIIEMLMTLLQLMLPTSVLDEVREAVKGNTYRVTLAENANAADGTASPTRPARSPTTSVLPLTAASTTLAAFQALEVMQLSHAMWQAPKPVPASELVEKGSSGGFFGKLFRVGGSSTSASTTAVPTDAAQQQEMVDIQTIVRQQRYLIAVDEVTSVRSTSAGVTATIGDFFAMSLCLKVVPLIVLAISAPTSPTPNITIALNAPEGNPIVMPVGYGPQQVQGIALLAQTIVGLCAGVVPAYSMAAAYQGAQTAPLQFDINAFMSQSLTSLTSVSPSNGQRVFVPHSFSLATTPASYPLALLPTTQKTKGSACALDVLQSLEQAPQPELRVSDVVAVSALAAVSLLQSMCVVPVPVAIAMPSGTPPPAPSQLANQAPRPAKATGTAAVTAAIIAEQQAYTYTVVASSPPPAVSVALGALLSALASPTRYLRSIVSVMDSTSSATGGIFVTPSPSVAGGDYIGLLMGGDEAAANDGGLAAHKATEARANLLFLVATCSYHLTTNPEAGSASPLVSFLRTVKAELDESDPAVRTTQRLLDGLRVAQSFVAKMLALHRAKRSIIATTSMDVGTSAAEDFDDCATVIGRTIEVPKILPTVNPFAPSSPSDATGESEEGVVAVEFQATMLNALLSIFVNCGPVVKGYALTSSVVQRLVFPMLLETSLRPEAAIHRVSFSLYLAIRRDFRGPATVAENGSFFTHVIFFLLESKNARPSHKRLVLQLLTKVAEEPRDLVETFLNYDCDKNSKNVFETLIRLLGEYTCGTAQPTLPSLNAPALVQYGIGGLPPPQGTASTAMIPVTLPSQSSPDSLYADALNVVLLLPNAVRQWIERFEDSIKTQEADALRERQGTGFNTLQAIEEINSAESKGPQPNANSSAQSSEFLEQHRMKRLFSTFFVLFNAKEKPNEAIALITGGSLPLPLVEGAIVDAVSAHREELARHVLVDQLVQPEPEGTPINMPRTVARFLHAHSDSIDKIVLGEYFSKMSRKEEVKKVFKEWVELFDFTKPLPPAAAAPLDPKSISTDDVALPIDEALRSFLGGFKILGEAQVVDKTMELFAAHYSDSVKAAVASVEQRWLEANPLPVAITAEEEPQSEEEEVKVDTVPASPVCVALANPSAETPDMTQSASEAEEGVTAASKHPLLVAVGDRSPTKAPSPEGFAEATPNTSEPPALRPKSPSAAAHDSSPAPTSSSSIYVLNQGTAFVLAFSMCMLNTDAHSAHVKQKMDRSSFIRNNMGIDDGKNVPPELLSDVYDRVSSNEIVLRPTPKLPPNSPQMQSQNAAKITATPTKSGLQLFGSALVAPIGLVFDVVKLPFDVAGELVFNTTAIEKQRQRERQTRHEMQAALTAALGQLRSSTSGGYSDVTSQAGLEHAIPMWESCADLVVTSLALALCSECMPSEQDSEHTDSAHAQLLLSAVEDCFAVCATFGFHEHVSILASLLRQLSMIDVIDPSQPLRSQSMPSPNNAALTAARRKSAGKARGQMGCLIGRPIAIKNLRCAFTLLDCVSAHRSRVASVAVWRHCYSILSRLELIHDKAYWVEAEEEASASASAQQLAKDGVSWMSKFKADINKAVGAGTDRNQMLDISLKTIAGISDPLARSLTVRNAIRRAIGRVRGYDGSATNINEDGTSMHPSFFTFALPVDEAADVSSASRPADGPSAEPTVVSFAQQAAMIIAVSREAQEEVTKEGRTHLLKHLTALLAESLLLAPKLQWNELWKRVAASVFLAGAMHPSARVAIDVISGSLHPLALKFLTLNDGTKIQRQQGALFQQDVLRPFETILVGSADLAVQEVVLDCAANLVTKAHANLSPSSGWHCILSLINKSSSVQPLVPQAWKLLKTILQQYALDALCLVSEGDKVRGEPTSGDTSHNTSFQRGANSFESANQQAIFDLKVFEHGIIYTLTSFACQPDEGIACEALLWLEACADASQYGLAALMATTQSPDAISPPRASPHHTRTFSADSLPLPHLNAAPVDIAMDLLVYVPVAPLSLGAPLRIRAKAASNESDGENQSFQQSIAIDASSSFQGPGLPASLSMTKRSTISALGTVAAADPRVRAVWQSLLECIAPIITIHPSLQARCVAISCFFSLLAKYGHFMEGSTVWDTVIWDASRSALLGHILSSTTSKRGIRLLLGDADAADSGDGKTGAAAEVSWSDVLTYLFLREAISATLECEGRLLRDQINVAVDGHHHKKFMANQRLRIGGWRTRLLSAVSERAMTDQRLLRHLPDPFAPVDKDPQHFGCGRTLEIVLNLINTVLLPAYLDPVAHSIASVVEGLFKPTTQSDDRTSAAAFVAANLQHILHTVSKEVPGLHPSKRPPNRFQSALERPLLEKIYLKRSLQQVLATAIKTLHDTNDNVTKDGLFIGPAASHSRSSFLSEAGNDAMVALLHKGQTHADPSAKVDVHHAPAAAKRSAQGAKTTAPQDGLLHLTAIPFFAASTSQVAFSKLAPPAAHAQKDPAVQRMMGHPVLYTFYLPPPKVLALAAVADAAHPTEATSQSANTAVTSAIWKDFAHRCLDSSLWRPFWTIMGGAFMEANPPVPSNDGSTSADPLCLHCRCDCHGRHSHKLACLPPSKNAKASVRCCCPCILNHAESSYVLTGSWVLSTLEHCYYRAAVIKGQASEIQHYPLLCRHVVPSTEAIAEAKALSTLLIMGIYPQAGGNNGNVAANTTALESIAAYSADALASALTFTRSSCPSAIAKGPEDAAQASDKLPMLLPASALLSGVLWAIMVQHRLGLGGAKEGSSPVASLLAAAAEDLTSVVAHIGALNQSLVRQTISTGDPPASGVSITATAKAAESATIKHFSRTLADALLSSQVSTSDTQFGLWSVQSEDEWVMAATPPNLTSPKDGPLQSPIGGRSAEEQLLARRLQVRNRLVILRASLLLTLRHILEASSQSQFPMKHLLPLLSVVPSVADEAPVLTSATLSRARGGLAQRAATIARKASAKERSKTLGTRTFRDVCVDVAYYLAAHTATGVAAESDDSDADAAEPNSPVGPQAQTQTQLFFDDIVLSSLYGSARIVSDQRLPIGITPPPTRVAAWIRDRCGFKGDPSGTVFENRNPLLLVRVATSQAVWEDVLLHMCALPMLSTSQANEPSVPKLTHPLVTLLQHYLNANSQNGSSSSLATVIAPSV